MRLTIIRDDNAVYIDGLCVIVDCSSLSEDIHAVQWNGQNGWVEFKDNSEGNKPANEAISTLEAFSTLVASAETRIAELKAQLEIELSVMSAASSTIPPQPNPSWIYNPTTNAWEAP
jgi:hypothetical protein